VCSFARVKAELAQTNLEIDGGMEDVGDKLFVPRGDACAREQLLGMDPEKARAEALRRFWNMDEVPRGVSSDLRGA